MGGKQFTMKETCILKFKWCFYMNLKLTYTELYQIHMNLDFKSHIIVYQTKWLHDHVCTKSMSHILYYFS